MDRFRTKVIKYKNHIEIPVSNYYNRFSQSRNTRVRFDENPKVSSIWFLGGSSVFLYFLMFLALIIMGLFYFLSKKSTGRQECTRGLICGRDGTLLIFFSLTERGNLDLGKLLNFVFSIFSIISLLFTIKIRSQKS